MERSIRTLVLLFGAFIITAVICAGLVFVLAGEELIDFARVAVVRFRVSQNKALLDQAVGGDPAPVRFTVADGDTPATIAANLVTAGLIADPDLLVDYMVVEGLDTELEAGIYFLNRTQTLRQIAHALTDSSSSVIAFTILPGWRLEQIVDAIDEHGLFGFSGADFMAVVARGVPIDPGFATLYGVPEGVSLEGFLFPDTYSLPPDITPQGLRDLLLQTFSERVGAQLVVDANSQGYTIYEMVTLASIIQREALHADEHPLIASVYRNRLNIGMRLDADPTVQYPLGGTRGGSWWPRITVADYRGVISDYNTYLNAGLPPGPIANPSLSAIRAAIYPVESSYFYFRADCRSDGYHEFATTYDEHLANGC